MERITDADVERAFREWCAMMGVSSLQTGQACSFRLGRDADGKFRIEQAASEGGFRVVAPGMTGREFCNAVYFLHESLNVKGQQVARMIGRKRKPVL